MSSGSGSVLPLESDFFSLESGTGYCDKDCMQRSQFSRRAFLHRSLAVTATAAIAAPALLPVTAKESRPRGLQPVRLGGPAFVNAGDPEELALAHRKIGYRAAYCPNVSLSDSQKIRAYAEAFAKQDVAIAEVGRWVNLLDSDPAKRKQNLQAVTDGFALAEAIGARCCVDIAGSMNPTSWFGPHKDNFSKEFFDAAVENARKIVDAAHPLGFLLRGDGVGLARHRGPLRSHDQGH